MKPKEIVKLPRQMPNGKATTKHPFLWMLHNLLGERSKRQLAIAIGVRAQTLYGWERRAEADRNFLLPGPRALRIAHYFKVTPAVLRPDLWAKQADLLQK